LLALEFYDPSSKKWGQAHMRARFAILRVLMKAGQGFVQLDIDSVYSDAFITLNRSQLLSVGQPAIADFLCRLQVYKATANLEAASALYSELTSVPDDWLRLRDLVVKKRQPRKVFCQPNIVERDGQVKLQEYDPTAQGMIQSFIDRGI
jgi:dipeptidyl-peptidase-3